MSTSLAIAAVTAKLRDLLRDVTAVVPGADVTTLAPDKALEETGNRVNLFLYQTTVNTGWSNLDMPGRVKSGETGQPPLALNLHYLVTAYTQDDNDSLVTSHRLLGHAMSILHDHTVLDWDEIGAALPTAEVGEQMERVRLTPQPLSVDEMSKLWTTFQAHYRPSAAYQASVVLIESTRPVSTPLPVLRRGEEDRGVDAEPGLIPPLPTLTRLEPPGKQPGLQFREIDSGSGPTIVGDELTIRGHHLAGDVVLARFSHPRLEGVEAEAIAAIAPAPEDVTATEITLKLSDTAQAYEKFPAGIYRLAIDVTRDEDGKTVTRRTNELPLSLSPRVVLGDTPVVGGVLTVGCRPHVWPKQSVALLLGSHEIPAASRTAKVDTLSFDVSGAAAGRYLVRLRIDGVDSLPVQDYEAIPLTFDEEQMVTIP